MPLLPVVHASPWLLIPLTLLVGLGAVFFICMAPELWREAPKRGNRDQVAAFRVMAVAFWAVGMAMGFAAIAYGYSVLYGWGVL